MKDIKEIRCKNCHKLLAKGDLGKGFIQIKCGKCGVMNNVLHSDKRIQDIEPGDFYGGVRKIDGVVL